MLMVPTWRQDPWYRRYHELLPTDQVGRNAKKFYIGDILCKSSDKFMKYSMHVQTYSTLLHSDKHLSKQG